MRISIVDLHASAGIGQCNVLDHESQPQRQSLSAKKKKQMATEQGLFFEQGLLPEKIRQTP